MASQPFTGIVGGSSSSTATICTSPCHGGLLQRALPGGLDEAATVVRRDQDRDLVPFARRRRPPHLGFIRPSAFHFTQYRLSPPVVKSAMRPRA